MSVKKITHVVLSSVVKFKVRFIKKCLIIKRMKEKKRRKKRCIARDL